MTQRNSALDNINALWTNKTTKLKEKIEMVTKICCWIIHCCFPLATMANFNFRVLGKVSRLVSVGCFILIGAARPSLTPCLSSLKSHRRFCLNGTIFSFFSSVPSSSSSSSQCARLQLGSTLLWLAVSLERPPPLRLD